jgi:hypothetical protein
LAKDARKVITYYDLFSPTLTNENKYKERKDEREREGERGRGGKPKFQGFTIHKLSFASSLFFKYCDANSAL